MPIWGIEIKSGRPFTLRPENQNGRLRISQATLDDGPSSKKSLLQCNVGNNAPILLCSLLPDKLESCTLDLEFEEEEDVVFSVLGPRSIHLSGYYVSQGHDHDDDESYPPKDIDVETGEDEESSYVSSEDEYDADFIVDDDVLEFDSPPRVSGVKIEEINDDEQPTDETDRPKLLKERKLLTLEASGSEDEDSLPISRGRGKKHSKDVEDTADLDKQPRDKKARKHQEDGEKVEAMGKKRNNDAFGLDGDHNKKLDPSETDDLKQSRKVKKKKKEVEKAHESGTTSLAGGPTGEASNNQHETRKEPGTESLKHDRAEKCLPKNTDGNVTEVHEGKKKKKKKKGSVDGDKPKEIEQSNLASSTSKGELDKSCTGAHPKKGTRTFPNGLVIEEISMGKPDGKRASPGSKVSVHYIGKLKNGEIFDSTVGKRPFKFRIGIGQVIQGWDVGINGMQVGDKRRLIIPPSMGYGSSGAGKIPPNAWLVFDVELVEVH